MIDVLVTLVSFVSPIVTCISCNYLHLHYASSPRPSAYSVSMPARRPTNAMVWDVDAQVRSRFHISKLYKTFRLFQLF
jgi:hypothetical protein